MGNEVTNAKTGEVTDDVSITAGIRRMESQFLAALPPHIPAERFVRVVVTAINGNPDLQNADRTSLFESAMKAAQDGLLPDGRDGALVIFKTKVKRDGREEWIKKVQWMPMIGGILKKVRNSGELLTISAHVAYANDRFFYRLGDEEKIEHEPLLDGERGQPKLVYAIAKTKDGGIYREVMTLADVQKVRDVSKAKDSGPWVQWWDEMARKTVLRRLAKRLPTSADLDDLLRQDDDLYDFKGQRAEPAPFTPLGNTLKDDAPEQIEAQPGQRGLPRQDSPDGDGGGKVIKHDEAAAPKRARGNEQALNAADLVISNAGKIIKLKGDGSRPEQIVDQRFLEGPDQVFSSFDEWNHACADLNFVTSWPELVWDEPGKAADAVSSAAAASAAPEQKNAPAATSGSAATAQPAKAEPYQQTAESYSGFLLDQFDKATSEAAIKDVWSKTRDDRRELLGADELEAAEKAREAAIARLRAKKGEA